MNSFAKSAYEILEGSILSKPRMMGTSARGGDHYDSCWIFSTWHGLISSVQRRSNGPRPSCSAAGNSSIMLVRACLSLS